jgi:hypothetical protein
MRDFRRLVRRNQRRFALGGLAVLGLGWLLLWRLGSLNGGLSGQEAAAANATYGWHGLYHHPFYLTLDILRSLVYFGFQHHGQLLTRLPNVLVGSLTIVAFAWLIRLWHGTRTAVLTGLLFACSAWVLHVSRLASPDVLYLAALPLLLVVHLKLQQDQKARYFYGSLLLWGVLLYVPGLIWLLVLEIWWQRESLAKGWRRLTGLGERILYALAGLIWLPLLVINLTRPGQLTYWLGFPAHWPTPFHYLKQLIGVPVHLFIRGPQYPTHWLGAAPILDIFTLLMSLIGIYFYARHLKAGRSRLLGSFFILGVLLISLQGAVTLSLVIPLLYIAAATGIAYVLHEWLQVFPLNPLARGVGIGLVSLAVALSCWYNLRAYFVAWPYDPTTVAVFQEHR